MPPSERIRYAWNRFSSGRSGCSAKSKAFPLTPHFDDGDGMITACRVLGLVDMRSLEKMSGMHVFSAGPHTVDDFNWSSVSFGHFNPKFVDWAVNNAIPAASDKAFKAATLAIYNDYFQTNVEAFLSSIYALESNPSEFAAIQKDFKAQVTAGQRISNYLFMSSYAQKFPRGLGNTSVMGFWVRRGVDGSAANFKKGLEKLVKTYTPERLPTIKTEATGKR
jgi:hypothetical protein